jgi:hypothetical protein
VLNHSLSQILPSLMSLVVRRLTWLRVKDVGTAEVRAESLRDLWPSHQLMNSKESQKFCFGWNFGVACVFVDSVEKIVLFVVIGS